jgi:signal peptidase I
LIVSAALFVAVAAAASWFFAPTQLGGSTRYVVTGGISMEPRFHTGDLALVRPADQYKVGDIVAYWSTLLHTVVLHRIHAIQGNTYVFKGDNNDFLDPVHPTRGQLLGKLWLHAPGAGKWLDALHSPPVAAVICAFLATGLLFGFGEQRRRRRKRRRKDAPSSLRQGIPVVTSSPDHGAGRRINYGVLLTASAVAAAVFVVLGLFAFMRPLSTVSARTTPYSQRVTFGYSATAPAGPVYQTGTVRTGDPIFLSLVHRLGVQVKYRFVSSAPHDISGTEEILLELASPTGWSRSLVLTPPTHFVADRTSTTVALDVPQVQSLLSKVSKLTGSVGGAYTIAVAPRVHITGSVAGHPLNLSFSPAMNFGLSAAQLLPQGASDTPPAAASASTPPAGASGHAFTSTRAGSVGTPGSAPASLAVLGISVNVSLLRWLSLIGLVLSLAATVYFYLRKRSEPFEETFRIQAQYGHIIVPIVGGEDLGWPPVDVPNIKALVRLAESGQRLILHNRSDNVDTYMVNEEGTVYRYQVKPSKVVWGDWSEPPAPLQEAA